MSRYRTPWWENGSATLAAGAWVVLVISLVGLAYGTPNPAWSVVLAVCSGFVAALATAIAAGK